MIDGLKPYPAMKDSGVPWLGTVPEHWYLERLKSAVRNVVEQTADPQSGDLYLALENVESWTGRLHPGRSEVTFDSQVKRFRAGDILFGKLRPYLAKVTRPASSGVCVGEFLVLRPDRLDGSAPYLEQLLRSKPVIDAVNGSTSGARMPRADWQFVGCMAVPLPPLPEQAAIARYLDHANRRIRRYIRAKQKLIRLLEEQKQAIIHRAVTRGLDPSARLRDSGVTWLGDIPGNWSVVRSKRIFSPRKEFARPEDEQLSATQSFGVIPQAEYERRVGRKIVKIFRHLEKRRHVEVNDFVISMRSFQGGLERAWVSGAIRSSYIVLQPSVQVDCDYFGFLFKSAGYIGALQATANFIRDGQDLNFENFCAVDLPLPSLEEQRVIAQGIGQAVEHCVSLLERTKREIDLVREFRTRLIADVVTGKVDVRAEAAGLLEMEEVEQELEPGVDGLEAEGEGEEAEYGEGEDEGQMEVAEGGV